ncbi:MAG TPA: bifunctional phosphopantothenoylcysteine decarboxylase/phosphopantothenate--cysteine ligase CoaBC, partial [Acidimicrobiales bacterium]|nr:bifunctional phosphopantothenoylcysteine decarboxylase/phosphopantothenate--cysteine ligase CoaBC [Acidimicrobiales bacterium]
MSSAPGPGPVPALSGKRVVLGVCGGIAAYKAVEVCRRLSDAGALVSPVLTTAATRFVGALTFSALADEPAQISLYDGPCASPHIDLARRADLVLVAPATARLLAGYATGASSDLLTATLLATRAPVLVCPAMHTEMWEHAAVQENVATLRRRGVAVLEPAAGRLAGGDYGPGRLPGPSEIVDAAAGLLSQARALPGASSLPTRSPSGGRLAGLRAVVSAGGTREPVDPVRFVGNRSSGRQGNAIAAALSGEGAAVTLVTAAEPFPGQGYEPASVEDDAVGPAVPADPGGRVRVVRVDTAA